MRRARLIASESSLACVGIGFTVLDEIPSALETRLPGWPFIDELDVSERVCAALPGLDRTHRFDLIQFADWQGVGFRTIQAKRAGLILPNAKIIVCSHGMSAWARDALKPIAGKPMTCYLSMPSSKRLSMLISK